MLNIFNNLGTKGLLSVLMVVALIALPVLRLPAQESTPPYKNPTLPIEKRVADLISRMTLEEKVLQMQNSAPSIPRLGIQKYDWWNEALHGVARAGIATVFPQAIGLAATFNEDIVQRVADATSTEARAKHHEAIRRGIFSRYLGLTFWTPNINIFRDPRWGRGQETYGEDPFLTGRLGSAFVRGLQGSDPKYLKTASTVKHFAVHSGPESERHSFDVSPSIRDLRETYLPAFRTTIVEAKAEGVMCAYNRLNGIPACANENLLREILRKEWQFKGHVVSDCGAVWDMYHGHKWIPTEKEAAAISVKSGTDLTCGNEYESLTAAIKEGRVSEADIDKALTHLFTIRFKLGMFDPPESVPYTKIDYSNNDSAVHRKIALEAARESIVLLKNEKSILPLRKDLKSIAVIGPSADDLEVLLANYEGQPSSYTTPLEGIRKIVSRETEVKYSPGMYPTGIEFEPIRQTFVTSDGIQGFKGEYFNNRDFEGKPALIRNDAKIDFSWGALRPAEGVNPDGYSVRWSGRIEAPETGRYSFGIRGNGNVRVYLDGKLLVEQKDNWWNYNDLKDVELESGKSYEVKIEYSEYLSLSSMIKLVWTLPSKDNWMKEEALKQASQADAVVMVMGISGRVEGEELKTQLDGFSGGDRTELGLPKNQLDLIKSIHALGKPVVLVLTSGSALAVNWESENIPAILQAWYPGEEGGSAIADVIFGDYNPAGRMPVTVYKSVDDIPAFDDYKMEGRTYRYFRGIPLYPFGYGLSYTSFSYDEIKTKNEIKAGDDIEVSAKVQNVGKVAGDEVVELYITDNSSTVPVPIRNLAGVKKIFLNPGESQTVNFRITPRQMSVILDDGRRVIEPGDFTVTVGGKQPGFKGTSDASTTGTIQKQFTVTGRLLEIKER